MAHYVTENTPRSSGRSTSGRAIQEYYEEWRANLPPVRRVRLDSERNFDELLKAAIKRKTEDKCDICGLPVAEEAAEYDHYPIAHRDGGPTVPENGRLVHKGCHPRGRPPADG